MSEAQIMEPFFTFAGHIQKITPSDAQFSEIQRSLLNKRGRLSLGFLLSSSADSATPAVISGIEPSGGCSV